MASRCRARARPPARNGASGTPWGTERTRIPHNRSFLGCCESDTTLRARGQGGPAVGCVLDRPRGRGSMHPVVNAGLAENRRLTTLSALPLLLGCLSLAGTALAQQP